jgi:hypothetical protein
MYCVSYQIIRNHKEGEGVLHPFDESNLELWLFGSNKRLVLELPS